MKVFVLFATKEERERGRTRIVAGHGVDGPSLEQQRRSRHLQVKCLIAIGLEFSIAKTSRVLDPGGQNSPRTSPPPRVQRARYVLRSILSLIARTLPSISRT